MKPLSCCQGIVFVYFFKGQRFSFSIMIMLTFSFFLVELIVGYKTNCMALIADSFHMLSDLLSLFVGFYSLVMSERRKKSKLFTYGLGRMEVLGALINCIFLVSLCLNIFAEAIQRIVFKEEIIDPKLILIVGGIGLVINILGVYIFHKAGSSGGCAHHSPIQRYTEESDELIGRYGDHDEYFSDDQLHGYTEGQMNIKGVLLHVIGDLVGSLVVMVSAGTFMVFNKSTWTLYLDPVMSLILVGILIRTTMPLLIDSSRILMLCEPRDIVQQDIVEKLMRLYTCIKEVHSFFVWNLSSQITVASVHIILESRIHFELHRKDLIRFFHLEGIHCITIMPEYFKGLNISQFTVCSGIELTPSLHAEITRELNQ